MENNEILNLILSKLDNLEKGQQNLTEEVTGLKGEVTGLKGEVADFKQEVYQRFDSLEREIKQTTIAIGDIIISSTENLDKRIVDTQNVLLSKIDDIDDMKLSIEVLDIVSKNNLKEINRLKVVK